MTDQEKINQVADNISKTKIAALIIQAIEQHTGRTATAEDAAAVWKLYERETLQEQIQETVFYYYEDSGQ